MSDKQFINDLSATYANIRRLDAKKIILKGKNILEYIGSSTPTVKHAQDTRETVTENDLWGQYIETKDDGTIIVHDDEVVNPNASNSSAWNSSITKVEDDKAYIGESGDTFFANIQTEKIKDGSYMFIYCPNLTSFVSDLSSLTDGNKMFAYCPFTTFTSDLSSLTDGNNMFGYCYNLTSFSSDLSSLTDGEGMFTYCPNLTSFSSDLPSLTNGYYMFRSCSQLPSFSMDLSSLTYSAEMFWDCTNLTIFNSDLPALTNGEDMFTDCTNLTSFFSNLSSLTYADGMFHGCANLISFTSDLPNLTYGYYMFRDCSNLISFSSNLSSLTSGNRMFEKCKLDAVSVMYIADTIKDITAEKQLYKNGTIPYVTLSDGVYSASRGFMSNGYYVYTYHNPKPYTTKISSSDVGKLTLGINIANNSPNIKQQLEDFAKEATFDSWADLKQHFSDKGWKVTFQYAGSTTSITYDLRNGEQIIPCPIFAKLVEADKDSAEYCTEDASTFYNIEWGHDVTDTSSYTQFNSLEDAMASWNVFPKENIIPGEQEA